MSDEGRFPVIHLGGVVYATSQESQERWIELLEKKRDELLRLYGMRKHTVGASRSTTARAYLSDNLYLSKRPSA